MDSIVQWSQIVMVVLMVIGLIYAWRQITIMQSSEANKKRLAVLALIQELEYNKKLIGEYKKNAEEGANAIPKDGKISWELNKPSFFAYEQSAILACGSDTVLLKDLTNLYEKLDACRTIIDEAVLIVANNYIECKIKNQKEEFNVFMGYHGKRLSSEAEAAMKLCDWVISRFESLDVYDTKRAINRNQLTVAWVMGVVISLVWCLWWFSPTTTTPRCLLVFHIVTFVIGSLLIYTLGYKRK